MTSVDEPKTVAERYSIAIKSSNLRVSAYRFGDADLIIAAGCAPDTLGASLVRLRGEYDGLKAQHRAAESRLQAQLAEAQTKTGDRPANPSPLPTPAALTARQKKAAAIKDATNAALTERALILSHLSGLHSTKAALGRHAVVLATKTRFMRPNRDALILAGRVLDVFLNPNCPHCSGRMFTGGGRHEDSGPQVICRPCGGTGKRRGALGKDDEERRFAGGLLSDIEQKASQFEQQVARHMRERD